MGSGSSLRSAFKVEDVKIEHKVFSLWVGSGCSSICWSETTRNASYILESDREGTTWIAFEIKDFIHSPSKCLDLTGSGAAARFSPYKDSGIIEADIWKYLNTLKEAEGRKFSIIFWKT